MFGKEMEHSVRVGARSSAGARRLDGIDLDHLFLDASHFTSYAGAAATHRVASPCWSAWTRSAGGFRDAVCLRVPIGVKGT
jgi:hypothetical protein